MGLFDKLFGRKKNGDPAATVSRPQQQSASAHGIVLKIPSGELQAGRLRNGVCFGDSAVSVKAKETVPLNQEGTEKGKPWLIFARKKEGGVYTQITYNFDRGEGELDQVSCQLTIDSPEDYEAIYAAYRQYLTGEYREPVDPKKIKVKAVLVTRAMENLAVMADMLKKLLKIEAQREHFDTWIVPVDGGKVKIDLLTLRSQGNTGSSYTLFLSYKLAPPGLEGLLVPDGPEE